MELDCMGPSNSEMRNKLTDFLYDEVQSC